MPWEGNCGKLKIYFYQTCCVLSRAAKLITRLNYGSDPSGSDRTDSDMVFLKKIRHARNHLRNKTVDKFVNSSEMLLFNQDI